MEQELATLGGGCFWCIEAAFQQVDGVLDVVPGYAGGTIDYPTYPMVCTGKTGHAEVVQLTFDPSRIDYGTLLKIFFAIHDPTTLNRQGADIGTQYRSVIFFHSPEQKAAAKAIIAAAEKALSVPVVTELKPFQVFYPAEAIHKNFYQANPEQGYCQYVIAPKLAEFRKAFAARLKPAQK